MSSKEFTNVDPKNDADIQAALALLERTRETQAKQRERLKNDPEAKARAAVSAKKRRVKDKILMRKATEAGITVTDDEIMAELEVA